MSYRKVMKENKNTENKNRLQVGSGPTYSDSPSDNVNSSITSSPTDTLRTSKNPTAKIIKNPLPVKANIQKFKNGDYFIDYSNGWTGALRGLRKLLQLQYRGNSNYADYYTSSGVFSLRLSGHNANGNNFRPEHKNISVFVAMFEYEHIPTKVKYTEYKITEETYNHNPQGVVCEIITAAESALNGAEFEMSKDIAEKYQYDS